MKKAESDVLAELDQLSLPSRSRLKELDKGIAKLLQDQQVRSRFRDNIHLLMGLSKKNLAQLAGETDIDPSHLSRAVNKDAVLSSLSLNSLAQALGVQAKTLLAVDLSEELLKVISRLEK